MKKLMYPLMKKKDNKVIFFLLFDHPVNNDIAAIFVVKGQGWIVVIKPKKIQLPPATIKSIIFFATCK